MRRMSYSKLTDLLRRIHDATERSVLTGQSAQEILEEDREFRKKLRQEHLSRKGRRSMLKGMGAAVGAMSLSPSIITTPVGAVG